MKVKSLKLPEAVKTNNVKFYDLYRDGVTQSFINKFLTCKEQCRLEYVEGWTPKLEPIWFTYGKLIHHVLSVCYATGEVNLTKVQQYILEYEKGLPQLNATDTQTKEIIFGLAELIIPYYFALYKDDFENVMHFNETNFKVPYFLHKNDPMYNNQRTIPIKGRLDAAFRKGNDLWVLDTKCLSMFDESIGYILPFDTQVMLYLWAVRKLQPGMNVKGFIYNIIRRPSHKITKKDITIKDFCQRVFMDICSRKDDFFVRVKMPISGEEIDQWEQKFLIPVLCEIEQWYNGGCKSYVNGNALATKYGHCAMFDLITKNDKTGYYQRSKPFSELV